MNNQCQAHKGPNRLPLLGLQHRRVACNPGGNCAWQNFADVTRRYFAAHKVRLADRVKLTGGKLRAVPEILSGPPQDTSTVLSVKRHRLHGGARISCVQDIEHPQAIITADSSRLD
jgi:hypothetical protein